MWFGLPPAAAAQGQAEGGGQRAQARRLGNVVGVGDEAVQFGIGGLAG